MITVTAKDALRSEVITPGWKVGVIKSYTQGAAKNDGSTLHKFEIEVEHNGMMFPVKDYQISEKAVSMGKNFFLACGFPQSEWDKLVKGEATSHQIDPNNIVGKKIKVFVSNTKWENRINNEATDFLPLEG